MLSEDAKIGSNLTERLGFPIRKSVGQRLLTPHHSLSQRATSFIACACQGIHQMPLPHACRPTINDSTDVLSIGEPSIVTQYIRPSVTVRLGAKAAPGGRPAAISIKPIHNVKDARSGTPAWHGRAKPVDTPWKGELVEPIGIEPMTSSLQS